MVSNKTMDDGSGTVASSITNELPTSGAPVIITLEIPFAKSTDKNSFGVPPVSDDVKLLSNAETHDTVKQANATMKNARKAMGKLNNVQQVAVLAGPGLMVAGFVAGSMSAKVTKPEDLP